MNNNFEAVAEIERLRAENARLKEAVNKLEGVVDAWESCIGLAGSVLIDNSDIGKALDYFDHYSAKVKAIIPWPYPDDGKPKVPRRQRWQARSLLPGEPR